MAEPAHEMSRECASLLLQAADSGQSVSEAYLREELGVGHDDLRTILDQLRESGQASEVAPGDWSGPDAEPLEPVVVSVSGEEEPEDRAAAAAAALRRRDGRHPAAAEEAAEEIVPRTSWTAGAPTVRLTAAIAETLSDEALGQLVKAGLSDADPAGVFVLEIVP